MQTSSRRKRCFNFTPELTQRLVKNAHLTVIACVSVGSAAVRKLQAAAHRLDCQGLKKDSAGRDRQKGHPITFPSSFFDVLHTSFFSSDLSKID